MTKTQGRDKAEFFEAFSLLTPPSAALARLTNAFANHQNGSRPRHRASVSLTGC
jgi:hypothetical protein